MKKFVSLLFNILSPKERSRLFIMAGFDLLMGIADVVFLIALLVIIRAYTSTAPVTTPLHTWYSLLVHANAVVVTGIFLLLFCIKNITGVLLQKAQHQYVYGVATRLSEKNMISYLKGNYLQFINVDSSVQIRQISHIPLEFSHYILTNFQQIIAQGILILFTTGAILLYHPALFVLLIILLFPPVIWLGMFIKKQLKKVRAQIKSNSVKSIQYLQESLSGYIESNIYRKSDFFTTRYHYYQQQLNQNIAIQQTLQGLSSRMIEIFALLGFFILISINKLVAGKFTIDVLTIGVFMAAAYKIIPGMVKILNSAGQMKTYSFTLHDMAGKDELRESHSTTLDDDQQIHSVSFSDVCFKFKESQVIESLSFEISPGDFAGISGISGRGKTTMINLLLGFLQQDSGIIAINNNALDAAERAVFWPKIAYVKQQGFFMNDTILKNITLTNDGYNKARLQQALSISGLEDFLSDYPEGIDKVVREHGKNISGGQRQRIALARALYHDFELLILDEPFSEIDEQAEQDILLRIQQLSNSGRMVLFITHNKTSLSFCNKIILSDAA